MRIQPKEPNSIDLAQLCDYRSRSMKATHGCKSMKKNCSIRCPRKLHPLCLGSCLATCARSSCTLMRKMTAWCSKSVTLSKGEGKCCKLRLVCPGLWRRLLNKDCQGRSLMTTYTLYGTSIRSLRKLCRTTWRSSSLWLTMTLKVWLRRHRKLWARIT